MNTEGLPPPTPRLCVDSLRHTGPHEQTSAGLACSGPVRAPARGALRKHWLGGGEKSRGNGERTRTRS